MIILKSWLNEWIDLSKIHDDKISEGLESLGFEIENFKNIQPDYKNIVVGKVVDIYSHDNADKLRVTQVDVGNNTFEIVCGAWNFDVGAIYGMALFLIYLLTLQASFRGEWRQPIPLSPLLSPLGRHHLGWAKGL